MRPLLDTNILLDFALARPGLVESSREVIVWCKDHPGSGVLTAHSLATLSYFLDRAGDRGATRAFLRDLVPGFFIAPIAEDVLSAALALPLPDFEDALVAAAAKEARATHIVTRNRPDFRRSPIPAIAPEDFLRLLETRR